MAMSTAPMTATPLRSVGRKITNSLLFTLYPTFFDALHPSLGRRYAPTRCRPQGLGALRLRSPTVRYNPRCFVDPGPRIV